MSVKGERLASKGVARQKRVQRVIVFSIFAVVATPPLLRHLKNKSADAVSRVLRYVAGYRT